MINFDDLEDLAEDVDLSQNPTLDLKVVQEKVPTYSTTKLCEMIVCDRYFGCYKEIAIMCMEELGKRRAAGENFNFEQYIEDAFNQLPKLDLSVPNISDVLNTVISRGKK